MCNRHIDYLRKSRLGMSAWCSYKGGRAISHRQTDLSPLTSTPTELCAAKWNEHFVALGGAAPRWTTRSEPIA